MVLIYTIHGFLRRQKMTKQSNKHFIVFWHWFCQSIADYYFYRGMKKGWNTVSGSKDLNKYNDWIDIKFMFEQE